MPAFIHGSLEHPNIVPVHSVGVDDEHGPIVVLKRVQGVSYKEELRKDRPQILQDPVVLEKHLRILMQVCNALHYAHSRGIVIAHGGGDEHYQAMAKFPSTRSRMAFQCGCPWRRAVPVTERYPAWI